MAVASPAIAGQVGPAGRRPSRPPALAAVASGLLCAAPVLALALLGWRHRWTADDGFINLRVVQQILAGNGPVFNAGERVEIGTSPAWIAVLLVASRVLFFIPLEWVAALVAFAFGLSAVVMAMVGAARLLLWPTPRPILFPAGALVFVAIPPAWDFTTSGLESSLGLAWLAGSFWVLACVATGGRRHRLWCAVLLGLGPVVRPDFALFSAAFLVCFLVIAYPGGPRDAVVVLVAAAAAPVGYQIFRMAYYASLVPNTALAKEAGRTNWDQGLFYVHDFVGTYRLWLPLAVLALVTIAVRWWSLSGPTAVVAATMTLAGAVHWLYVVRVGGDFMHARLLLPGLFAMVLPVAVVPLRRLRLLCLAIVPWAVVVALHARPVYREAIFGPRGLVNERLFYVRAAGNRNPVTLDDYPQFWAEYGRIARRADQAGERVVFLDEESFGDPRYRVEAKPDVSQVVVAFRYVGMLSYAAGPRVRVVDRLGLGDPIAGRLVVTRRGRPGHEKELDLAWVVARFVPPGAAVPLDDAFAGRVEAARRALRCPPLDRLLRAVDGPLSPSRALANISFSVRTRSERFEGDPVAAERSLCPDPMAPG